MHSVEASRSYTEWMWYTVPVHRRAERKLQKLCTVIVYIHAYKYISDIFIAFFNVWCGPWDHTTGTAMAIPVVAGATTLA